MVLLIVNSLDGNENILPLAWALVPVENFENWEWFLSKISPYLHGMDSAIAVTISDKQKGLTKALSIHLPDAAKCHCCQHIAENIRARYGTKSGLVRLFWRAARAKEKAGYNSVLAEIKNVNERCHTYLSEIPPILYARHAFHVPRFDHDTSNISESINSHWLPGRTLLAFRLLVWVWSWMTTKCYKRQHQKFKGNCYTDIATTYLEKQAKVPVYYTVVSSRDEYGVVTAVGTQTSRIIDLVNRTCTCGDFQERGIPCRHAQELCKKQKLMVEDYISDIYKIERYRDTYQYHIPPLRLIHLSHDLSCKEPLKRTSTGRPRLARVRKSSPSKKTYHCSICGEADHSKRRCARTAPRTESTAEEAYSDFSWTGISSTDEEDDQWIITSESEADPDTLKREERRRGRHRDEIRREEELAREEDGAEEDGAEDVDGWEIRAIQAQLATELAAQERRDNEKAVGEAERAVAELEAIESIKQVSDTSVNKTTKEKRKKTVKPSKSLSFKAPLPLREEEEETPEERAENERFRKRYSEREAESRARKAEIQKMTDKIAASAAKTAAIQAAKDAAELDDPEGDKAVIRIHLSDLRKGYPEIEGHFEDLEEGNAMSNRSGETNIQHYINRWDKDPDSEIIRILRNRRRASKVPEIQDLITPADLEDVWGRENETEEDIRARAKEKAQEAVDRIRPIMRELCRLRREDLEKKKLAEQEEATRELTGTSSRGRSTTPTARKAAEYAAEKAKKREKEKKSFKATSKVMKEGIEREKRVGEEEEYDVGEPYIVTENSAIGGELGQPGESAHPGDSASGGELGHQVNNRGPVFKHSRGDSTVLIFSPEKKRLRRN